MSSERCSYQLVGLFDEPRPCEMDRRRMYGGEDPVLALMSQRRRSGSYTRPAAKAQLHNVAAAVLRGAPGLGATAHAWQGTSSRPVTSPRFGRSRTLCIISIFGAKSWRRAALWGWRATIEELLGEALPPSWDDQEAILISTGRFPIPFGFENLAGQLPLLTWLGRTLPSPVLASSWCLMRPDLKRAQPLQRPSQ